MLVLSGGQVETLFDFGLPVEVRAAGGSRALDRLLEERELSGRSRRRGRGAPRSRPPVDPDGPLRAG